MDRVSIAERNIALIRRVIPMLGTQPWFELSALARASGESEWALRRAFGQIEAIYRHAFALLVREAIEQGCRSDRPGANVAEIIRACAIAYAALMEGPGYQSLLRLLLQSGSRFPWMNEEHPRLIASLASALQRRIGSVSENYRSSIGIPDKAALRFVGEIEIQYGLRSLMGSPGPAAGDMLKTLVAETHASTYRLDWVRS